MLLHNRNNISGIYIFNGNFIKFLIGNLFTILTVSVLLTLYGNTDGLHLSRGQSRFGFTGGQRLCGTHWDKPNQQQFVPTAKFNASHCHQTANTDWHWKRCLKWGHRHRIIGRTKPTATRPVFLPTGSLYYSLNLCLSPVHFCFYIMVSINERTHTHTHIHNTII